MDTINAIVHQSRILTNHSMKKSLSLPSLPTFHRSAQYLPPAKHKNLNLNIKIKAKQELIKQERLRNLLKLKINLNSESGQLPSISRGHKETEQQRNQFVQGIQNRLNSLMNIRVVEQKSEPIEEIDPDKEQFVKYAHQLSKVHVFARKQNNKRFTNKISRMATNMKAKESLKELFGFLSDQKLGLSVLYRKYEKLFTRVDDVFRKELRVLAVESQSMIKSYENNRFKHKNEDIRLIRIDVSQEGREIGGQLSHIDNFGVRKGIFRSLKTMEFDCLANRNYYSELSERLKNAAERR